MKNYIKPTMQIIDSLSDNYCAVVLETVSENEVNDRLVLEAEDLFNDL